MSFDFYTLKNGVRVLLAPMTGVQSVGVGVFVGTGSRFETPEINGISHFLEHMVFKGTKNYPTHTDTSRLEGLGAIQNAWTDVDATAYWCKIPSDKWQQGLDLVKDLALYPTFPKSDLEIERGVILEEIRRRDDRPDELAGELLGEVMFPGDPLEMTVLGKPEVIKNLTRDQFISYHQSRYKSDNLAVVIAGAEQFVLAAKPKIDGLFASLPTKKSVGLSPVSDVQTEPRLQIKHKQLSNQAHLEIGVRGVSASDPRRFALSLLTTYLGQGLSSRLFVELREKRGLCYAVHASETRLADIGVWDVYAGVAIDKLEAAVEAIIAEIRRLTQVQLTADELAQIKEKLRGPLLFSMEDPVRQMEYYARQVLDRPQEILDHNAVVDRLMQITTSDIQQVARELFTTAKLNLAIVGPVDPSRSEGLLKLLKI